MRRREKVNLSDSASGPQESVRGKTGVGVGAQRREKETAFHSR